MVVSAVAIINAKRVWCGAPQAGADATAPPLHPDSPNALLAIDGCIDFIGSTEEVLARLEATKPRLSIPEKGEEGGATAAVFAGRPRPHACRIIDCKHTACVYPGFIDSHVHLMDGGRSLLSPDATFATSRSQFIDIFRDFINHRYDRKGGNWVHGWGWSEAVLGGEPHRSWLDEVAADIPIVAYSKDGHSCVMNTVALRLCHIIPGAADDDPIIETVDGGRIERDQDGQPSGILRDNAIFIAKRYAPRTDSWESKCMALQAAEKYLLARGFTTAFSMMSTRFKDNISEIDFLRQMEAAGKMHLRVRYGVPIEDMDRMMEEFYRPVKEEAVSSPSRCDGFSLTHRFTCTPLAQGGGYCVLGAVKLFSDGSLSSQTAAMNRPFGYDVATDGDINSNLEDDEIAALLLRGGPECQCGLLTMPRVELRLAVRKTHAAGLQCVVHAIGDRAVATVNKVLSESAEWLRTQATEGKCNAPGGGGSENFQLQPRSRVEHCQHIANVSKEVRRMQANDIIASMQPCHLLFDGDYIDELLGSRRKATSYMWGTFLREGIRVALGSDWPIAPADVNDGLRGSVTRVPDVMTTLAAESAAIAAGADSETAAAATQALRRYHDVWNEAECLSMEAALRAYTYESAYGAFMEDYVGTLAVGKFADISVWSDDFLDRSGMKPLGVSGKHASWWPQGREPQVLYTIVGGAVEYERNL